MIAWRIEQVKKITAEGEEGEKENKTKRAGHG
jgi:hypothetical protein